MATTINEPDLEQGDSSSFTGSFLSTSTVPGPGAITGRFLKKLGEKSLDLVVVIIIRRRLAAIERTLEKSPHMLCDPTDEEEWKRMTGAHDDLHELCRESRSKDYPLSLQRTAANLIHDITLLSRIANSSLANERWEKLFALVQCREELLPQWQPSIVSSGGQDSNSSHSGVPAPSGLQNERSGISVDVNIEVSHSNEPLARITHNRRRSSLRGLIFKSWVSETFSQEPHSTVPVPNAAVEQPGISPRDHTRKVLVLGAGGVGKSTLVKQIQASVDHTLSSDLVAYKEIIVNNMWRSMKNILANMDSSDVSFQARPSFLLVSSHEHPLNVDCVECRSTMGDTIRILCEDPAVRRSARELKLGKLPDPKFDSTLELDCVDYFFDSVLRISEPDYIPTTEDVVRCRIRTTGIHTLKCGIKGSPGHWLVTDTGGERSERRKWLHCFENVTAVIFVAALSDYNKTLYEDPDVNRMAESLILFDSIVNSRWFTKTLMILLFNKNDLFAEQLGSIPLKDYFPDYTGRDFFDACEYFEARFLALVQDKSRRVIVKYGRAIDAEATLGTFSSITDEIDLHYNSL